MEEKTMEEKKELKEEELDKVDGGAFPMKWRKCNDCGDRWYGSVKVKSCPNCGSKNTEFC